MGTCSGCLQRDISDKVAETQTSKQTFTSIELSTKDPSDNIILNEIEIIGETFDTPSGNGNVKYVSWESSSEKAKQSSLSMTVSDRIFFIVFAYIRSNLIQYNVRPDDFVAIVNKYYISMYVSETLSTQLNMHFVLNISILIVCM